VSDFDPAGASNWPSRFTLPELPAKPYVSLNFATFVNDTICGCLTQEAMA
jgi:hypothetical protein